MKQHKIVIGVIIIIILAIGGVLYRQIKSYNPPTQNVEVSLPERLSAADRTMVEENIKIKLSEWNPQEKRVAEKNIQIARPELSEEDKNLINRNINQ
jgi:hypothetical protein